MITITSVFVVLLAAAIFREIEISKRAAELEAKRNPKPKLHEPLRDLIFPEHSENK